MSAPCGSGRAVASRHVHCAHMAEMLYVGNCHWRHALARVTCRLCSQLLVPIGNVGNADTVYESIANYLYVRAHVRRARAQLQAAARVRRDRMSAKRMLAYTSPPVLSASRRAHTTSASNRLCAQYEYFSISICLFYVRTRRSTHMRALPAHTTRQSATLPGERHVDVAPSTSTNTSTTATHVPQMDHPQTSGVICVLSSIGYKVPLIHLSTAVQRSDHIAVKLAPTAVHPRRRHDGVP
ncbi:unnamed protein product [Sphagnum balticum]